MNALGIGGLIILYLLLANAVAAYVETQAAPANVVPGCEQGQNFTACNDVGTADFVDAVLDVSVTGINGAPDDFNGFWLFINLFLLILATLLIVSYFVGLPFGGSA